MLIIAHRGASGERPEHTLASYERAIDQGADFIEFDLVATQDGVLVARHENAISGTTNIAQHPEFAARLTTRTIDGREITDWFTEDFTLAELRTLRARERAPQIRPQNTAYDGLYQVPTLAEIIALVRAKEAETGRTIGLYPEIKHPTYFASIGHDLAVLLVEGLHDGGYFTAMDPVFIQCFEVGPLARLRGLTEMRLVQLVDSEGGPADQPEETYASMLAPEGLINIAQYADVIGTPVGLLLDADGAATPLTQQAHNVGLEVHTWTLRRENAFLPRALQLGANLGDPGDMAALVRLLQQAGVDGAITDNPAIAVPVVGVAGQR